MARGYIDGREWQTWPEVIEMAGDGKGRKGILWSGSRKLDRSSDRDQVATH